MKIHVFFIFILLVATLGGAKESSKMFSETISGKSVLIIEAALPEAKKRNLDLKRYRVSVAEDNTTYDGKPSSTFVVSFIDKEAPSIPSGVGNPGKIPGLEVVLDRETLALIKAHFIR